MRDIRFRAWDNEMEMMVYQGDDEIYICFDGEKWKLLDYSRTHWETDEYGMNEIEQPWEVENIEIMQYTGRKDSEGNEIYEGDILQNEHYFKYQVVFKGDCWRCEPLKRNSFKNRFIGNDLKIIGTIHENKQLLED